jgi:hypothetical protein
VIKYKLRRVATNLVTVVLCCFHPHRRVVVLLSLEAEQCFNLSVTHSRGISQTVARTIGLHLN